MTTSHFPAHLDIVERRIIDRLISLALAADYKISVADEEGEFTLNRSNDRAAIQRETGITGMTRYVIRERASDLRLGSILLIHGNGGDVISDYSWNDQLTDRNAEAIIDELCQKAVQ